MKYTEQELLIEIEKVKNDDYSIKQKRELAAKYELPSAKAADIIKSMYTMVGDIRRAGKPEYTEQDFRNFMNEVDLPVRYKNAEKFLAAEPKEFIEFCKARYADKISKSNANLQHFAQIRTRCNDTHYLSHTDMYTLNMYLNFVEYLDSIDETVVAARNNKADRLLVIVETLNKQMVEFKKAYLEAAKERATTMWRNIPNRLETLDEQIKAISEWKENWYEENRKTRQYRFSWDCAEFSAKEKMQNKLERERSSIKSILYRFDNMTDFVNSYVKDAAGYFNSCVHGIAERIDRKELDVKKMEVNNIGNDPKFFTMHITDGTHNMYARSIWAADYSEKVSAHLRFIITERKPSKK